MALTTGQVNSIQTLANMANDYIKNKKPLQDAYNVLFNSSGGWSSTIQQADLDGSKFAGLQLSDLLAAVGCMTGAINTDIGNNEAFLAKLAVAGGN